MSQCPQWHSAGIQPMILGNIWMNMPFMFPSINNLSNLLSFNLPLYPLSLIICIKLNLLWLHCVLSWLLILFVISLWNPRLLLSWMKTRLIALYMILNNLTKKKICILWRTCPENVFSRCFGGIACVLDWRSRRRSPVNKMWTRDGAQAASHRANVFQYIDIWPAEKRWGMQKWIKVNRSK